MFDDPQGPALKRSASRPACASAAGRPSRLRRLPVPDRRAPPRAARRARSGAACGRAPAPASSSSMRARAEGRPADPHQLARLLRRQARAQGQLPFQGLRADGSKLKLLGTSRTASPYSAAAVAVAIAPRSCGGPARPRRLGRRIRDRPAPPHKVLPDGGETPVRSLPRRSRTARSGRSSRTTTRWCASASRAARRDARTS